MYHDLNVCYYGKPIVNINKTETVRIIKFHNIKIKLLKCFQMLLLLLIMTLIYICVPTQATVKMCISKRQKNKCCIIIAACTTYVAEDTVQVNVRQHKAV